VKRRGITRANASSHSVSRFSSRLSTGEMAPVTGTYRVVHQEHRPDHDAVIIRGENLPACRTCKGDVQVIVQSQASHITHDFDFAGPNLLIVGIAVQS
jgi:hypothetical protein